MLHVFLLVTISSSSFHSSSQSSNNEIVEFNAANLTRHHDRHTGIGFANFFKFLDKALDVTPYRVVPSVQDYHACSVICTADPVKCLSFNFFRNENGRPICELLDKDMFDHIGNFTNKLNSVHFTFRVSTW